MPYLTTSSLVSFSVTIVHMMMYDDKYDDDDDDNLDVVLTMQF